MVRKMGWLTMVFLISFLTRISLADDCLTVRDKDLVSNKDFSGTECVDNLFEPEENEIWQLHELWRAGDVDDDVFFGFITRAFVLGKYVYVLDTKLSTVYQFDLSSGKLLRSYDVAGEGPGYCDHPGDLLYYSGSFVLKHAINTRLIPAYFNNNVYGAELSLLIKEAKNSQSFSIANAMRHHNGSDIILAYQETYLFEDMKQVCTLSAFSTDGQELARFLQNKKKSYFIGIPVEADLEYYGNEDVFDTDREKVYAVPYRDEYSIFVFSVKTGRLEKVIKRSNYRHRYRSDQEIYYESYLGPDASMEVEDTAPDILDIHCVAEGLLVRNSFSDYHQPSGIFRTYDFFNKDGIFVKTISLAFEKGWRDKVYFFDDIVIVIKGYFDAFRPGVSNNDPSIDTDPMQIIVCRLER